MSVQSARTNKIHEISGRLLEGLSVWEQYGIIYNSMSQLIDPNGEKLFRDGFKKNVLDKQKRHFENCWGEPIIDGKHYHENVDGKFTLYRGTNRNESLHRRIRDIWPDTCSEETGQRLKLCFMYNWNMKRITGTGLNHTHAALVSELHELDDHSFVSSISNNNINTIAPQSQQGLSKREEQDVVVKEERPKKKARRSSMTDHRQRDIRSYGAIKHTSTVHGSHHGSAIPRSKKSTLQFALNLTKSIPKMPEKTGRFSDKEKQIFDEVLERYKAAHPGKNILWNNFQHLFSIEVHKQKLEHTRSAKGLKERYKTIKNKDKRDRKRRRSQ